MMHDGSPKRVEGSHALILRGGKDVTDSHEMRRSTSFKSGRREPGMDDSRKSSVQTPMRPPEKEIAPREVRKRPLQISPPDVNVGVGDKQRLVSKALIFAPAPEGPKGIARCLFGAPTEELNEAVQRAYEKRSQKEFGAFVERWDLGER